jgi:hypothetical protein
MLKVAITLKELCRNTIKALKVSNEIIHSCPNKQTDIPALLHRRVDSVQDLIGAVQPVARLSGDLPQQTKLY